MAGEFPGFGVGETVVSLGRPAETFATIAEEREAGLIVMGLAGGTDAVASRPVPIAYRVRCLATVPVLVGPPE